MNRIDIINNLIVKNNYKTYLEIGVRTGDCIAGVNCSVKVGVDPDLSSAANLHLTSDEFFENIKKISKQSDSNIPITYDIIFIDGLHHADQVYKDILNSLSVLNEGGTIVMHDCLPTSRRMQEIPLQEQGEWTGNTWEAYVQLRMERTDLYFSVVDTDWGCGIIRKGHQNLLKPLGPVDYDGFLLNRQEWMNIISVAQFKQKYLD